MHCPLQKTLTYTERNRELDAALVGPLSAGEVGLIQSLAQRVESEPIPQSVQLDLRAMEGWDSQGLSALLQLQQSALNGAAAFHVIVDNPAVALALQTAGITEVVLS